MVTDYILLGYKFLKILYKKGNQKFVWYGYDVVRNEKSGSRSGVESPLKVKLGAEVRSKMRVKELRR